MTAFYAIQSWSDTSGSYSKGVTYNLDESIGNVYVQQGRMQLAEVYTHYGDEKSVFGDYDRDGKLVALKNKDGTDSTVGATQFPATILPSTLRGITNRGGFPNQNTSGQLLGKSVFTNIAGDINDARLVFVAVFSQNETPVVGGTLRATVETPPDSGNWYDVTFNAVSSATLSAANLYILISDQLPTRLKMGQELDVYASGLNNLPTMTGGDWMYEQIQNREYQLQLTGTDQAAMQVNQLNRWQLKNAKMAPRGFFSTGATNAASVETIQVPTHGQVSTTNLKALITGFVPTAINGLFQHTLSGANAITIPLADPGPVTQNGMVQFVSTPTAASWSGGFITITRASHGLLPGITLTLRGFSSTVSINRDLDVFDVTDANNFRIAFPSDPGAITVTSAYYFSKYMDVISSNNYHLRPFTIVGTSETECTALIGDSTTQQIDVISDNTRLLGVLQRMVGEVIPFVDVSASGDSLTAWVSTFPNNHLVRNEIIRLFAQTGTFGMSKNDETTYTETTVGTWNSLVDQFFALPSLSVPLSTGKNKAVLVPTGTAGSTTFSDFTSMNDQVVGNNYGALPFFHSYLKSKLGTLFNKIFDYQSLLTVLNQPTVYKFDPTARNITYTSITTSPVITVDAGTPISSADNGKLIGLQGAISGGNGVLYVIIKYVSPTSFIAMQAKSKNRTISGTPIAVTSGTARIGVRRYVDPVNTATTTIHESREAIQSISAPGGIALKP